MKRLSLPQKAFPLSFLLYFVCSTLPAADTNSFRYEEKAPAPAILLTSSSENWSEIDSGSAQYMLTIKTDFNKTPADETFSISNAGEADTILQYFVNENSSWLSASPIKGDSTGATDTNTITVSFNTSSLAIGNYTTTIKVSDSYASNSPRTILVNLSVGPEEIPKEKLVAGFAGGEAGNATTDETNQVSYWADVSGSGNDAYQRNKNKQPTLVSTLLGKSVLYFSGKDSLLFENNNEINEGGPYSEKSIVLAFRTGADINTGQVLFEQGDSKRGLNIYIADSQIFLNAWNLKNSNGVGTTWGPLTLSGNITQNTYHYLLFIFDQPNSLISAYLNGNPIGEETGAGLLYGSSQSACLGNKDGNTYTPKGVKADGFTGYICQFYYYNSVLSIDDRTSINLYFNNLYTNTFSGANAFSVWLNAAQGVNIDTRNNVESWSDSSHNHLLFQQKNVKKQPILNENATVGNQPCIEFDGSATSLLAPSTDAINSSPVGYTNKTIIVVFETGGDVLSPQVIWNQGDKKTGMNIVVENGLLSMSAWNLKNKKNGLWGPVSVSGAITGNTLYYAQLTYNYSDNLFKGYLQKMAADEDKITLGPAEAAVGALPKHAPATIGFCRSSTVNCGDEKKGKFFDGTICEIIIYNQNLTASQRTEIDSYINNKYNP